MNCLNAQHGALKRRWDGKSALYSSAADPFYTRFPTAAGATLTPSETPSSSIPRKLLGLSSGSDDTMASHVVPPVTVVLEDRAICHRIQLHKHDGYGSLAIALRRMLVDAEGDDSGGGNVADGLDLSNAVPGHLVAYEDVEDDLLLAGDLNWKDFVRVVKRIRIIPAKTNRWKHYGGAQNVKSSRV